jgi:hypothetical protein
MSLPFPGQFLPHFPCSLLLQDSQKNECKEAYKTELCNNLLDAFALYYLALCVSQLSLTVSYLRYST